jgi:hypothetical protein
VAIHRSGRAIYTLDGAGGAGVQLVALPDSSTSLSSLVLDARPATGEYDQYLAKGGVSLHLVDQGAGDFDRISVNRRHAQAIGGPLSYDHVVVPGQTLSVHGVTVSVLAAAGGGYEVSISGQYHRPGPLSD